MKEGCLLICAVVFMAWLLSFGWAASDEIENLAMGGDFENEADLAKWTFNLFASAGNMAIDRETAATGEASAYVNVIQGSGWDPRPYQGGHPIKEGRTYTLSACIKAEEPRSILLRLHEPGTWTVVLQKTVSVGTDWEEYWVTGTAQQDIPGEISFCNNSATINYWLDNVKFYEGEYVPLITQKQVAAMGKLSTTWGALKRQSFQS